MEHRVGRSLAAADDPIITMDDQDAAHDRHAEQRDESDGGRNAQIQSENRQPQDTAADREWKPEQRQQAVTERIEKSIEQHQDEDEGDGENDRKSFFSLLQPFELAGPIDAITGWHFHVGANALLGFLHRAREVATTYAEFDRYKALVALAKNVGGTGVERDGGA